jgi:hypothetical protein
MLASYIHNDRKKIGISESEYKKVISEIESNMTLYLDQSEHYLLRIINLYTKIFESRPGAFRFQVDQAHLDNFSIFRSIERLIGVNEGTIIPSRFSSYPTHSLGGNRAPFWIAKEKNGLKIKSNARLEYYRNAESIGDWKIDNKYQSIFPSKFIEAILQREAYIEACNVMNYNKEVFA